MPQNPKNADGLFGALVDFAPDAVVIVDEDGRITLVNAQTEAMFGYSRDELLGREVEALLPGRFADRHRSHRAGYAAAPRVRAMGGLDLELRGQRRDGSEFPVEVSLSPVDVGDQQVVMALVRDVTDNKAAEERLAYLAAIIESTDDAVFAQDPAGVITSWNRSAERLYGYSGREAVGSPAETLLPPNRKDVAGTVLGRVLAGERVDHFETVIRRRDGMLVDVSLTMSRILSKSGEVVGVSATARDLTEQRVGQATLAEAQRRLRESEALAHVGSWIWDAEADVVQWSDELHKIHGLTPFEFDGTLADHLALVYTEDRERVETEMRHALASDEPFESEYRIVRPDATTTWLFARADPARGRDGAGLRGICQDITERRRAQEAIRSAYELERAAADELRAADALKDDFLATVSHELRTPLTSIMGFTHVLELNASDDQLRYIEPISRNADEMSRMIERLLDFSRLSAGEVAFRPVHLPLLTGVERALASLAGVLEQHRIVVDVREGLTVLADPDALDRILGNLLTNAAKFSPEGSTLTISGHPDGTEATVSVHDQGRGVAPELRNQIFERFYQAPNQPAGKRGTGVGLGIVRRYVELHGGRVWCEADPGEGSTFSFTLPMAGVR
jgi:PAS domain S-box-containing protein